MSKPPINAAGVAAAVAMMRPPIAYDELKHFVAKTRVLMHVARYEAREKPLLLGRTVVSERTGLNPHTARKCLLELVDDRVLERLEDRAGSRATAYRINPEVRHWRVRWQVPLSLVEVEVGFATGEFRTEDENLSRALWSARKRKFVARAIDRAANSDDSVFVARAMARATNESAFVENPRTDARQIDGDPLGSSPTTDEIEKTSLTEEEERNLNKVCWAIAHRVGDDYVFGRPRARVENLIREGATLKELLELVAVMPSGCRSLSGTEWMVQHWHGAQLDDVPSVDTGAERDRLLKRAEKLPALIASFREAGIDEEVLKLEAEAVEIVTTLDNLDRPDANDDDDRQAEA